MKKEIEEVSEEIDLMRYYEEKKRRKIGVGKKEIGNVV